MPTGEREDVELDSSPSNAAIEAENQPPAPEPAKEPAAAVDTEAPAPSDGEQTPNAKGVDSEAKPAKAKPAAPPDPVQEAIAHLSKPPKRPQDAKPAAKAPKEAPKAESPPKEPPKAAEDPAKGAPPLDEDPLAGFDEHQRAALKQQTQDRIKDLHRRWKAAEQEITPEVREIRKALTDFQVDGDLAYVGGDHLAGLVASQAAINRTALALSRNAQPSPRDLDIVRQTAASVAQIAERFGVAVQPAAAPEIKPFEGELPSDLEALVSVYGLDEKRVRLLAALEKRAPAPAPKQAPPAASPVAPVAAPPPPPPAPREDPLEAAYSRRAYAAFAKDGVPSNELQAHWQALGPMIVDRVKTDFPGLTPGTEAAMFDSLPVTERHSIVMAAHQAWMAKNRPPPPKQPAPPAPTARAPLSGRGTPPARGAQSSGDPVKDAISYLTGS